MRLAKFSLLILLAIVAISISLEEEEAKRTLLQSNVNSPNDDDAAALCYCTEDSNASLEIYCSRWADSLDLTDLPCRKEAKTIHVEWTRCHANQIQKLLPKVIEVWLGEGEVEAETCQCYCGAGFSVVGTSCSCAGISEVSTPKQQVNTGEGRQFSFTSATATSYTVTLPTDNSDSVFLAKVVIYTATTILTVMGMYAALKWAIRWLLRETRFFSFYWRHNPHIIPGDQRERALAEGERARQRRRHPIVPREQHAAAIQNVLDRGHDNAAVDREQAPVAATGITRSGRRFRN